MNSRSHWSSFKQLTNTDRQKRLLGPIVQNCEAAVLGKRWLGLPALSRAAASLSGGETPAYSAAADWCWPYGRPVHSGRAFIVHQETITVLLRLA